MENQNKKIANLQLHISESCSELDKEMLSLYWELDELEPRNTAKVIRKKFSLSQSELTKTYQFATLSFYLFCEHCNSFEYNEAKSHSRFKEEIRKVKFSLHTSFKCECCTEIEKEKIRLAKEKKHQEFIKNLQEAIENKNWNNLTNFEKGVLKNSLDMSFDKLKKHYGKILGQERFITLIRALENIETQNLIVIDRDFRNYISGIRCLKELSSCKNDIVISEENTKSTFVQDLETNKLKFKLLINTEQHHPDSPLYAGTVVFKERVVIEPNVEYTFAQWERVRNQLYLTMIPTSELEKAPIVKSLSKQPKHIKNHINNYFKRIGSNLDFE